MSSKIHEKVIKLAQKLEASDTHDFSFLKETVVKTGFSVNDLKKYASFSHPTDQSYGRNLLYESHRLKIFLMCWSPGDFTAIHDHGQTRWGCVIALGNFTHRVYHFENGILKIKSDAPLGAGQVACLKGDFIHMMGNKGNINIMSLHIYGSDSKDESLAKRSRVYQIDKKMVITTNGPAFLNTNDESILHQEHFDSVDQKALTDYIDLIKYRSEKVRQSKTRILTRQVFTVENHRPDNIPVVITRAINNAALLN
ncbi:MAG: cysteine dioxygenase family protein [Bacteroidales bacterium]